MVCRLLILPPKTVALAVPSNPLSFSGSFHLTHLELVTLAGDLQTDSSAMLSMAKMGMISHSSQTPKLKVCFLFSLLNQGEAGMRRNILCIKRRVKFIFGAEVKAAAMELRAQSSDWMSTSWVCGSRNFSPSSLAVSWK